MTMLYSVRLALHVAGFGNPSVRAIRSPALAGHYDPTGREIMAVDANAALACLPARWHAAFKRAPIWYPHTGCMDEAAHATLRSPAGTHMNTVYFVPYHFDAAPGPVVRPEYEAAMALELAPPEVRSAIY